MLGRRSFLISCSWVAAAFVPMKPGCAGLSQVVLPSSPLEANETRPFVLSIAGWDMPRACEQGGSSRVWISINQSWRVAWR